MAYPYSGTVSFAPAHAPALDHTNRNEDFNPFNFMFHAPPHHYPPPPSSSSSSTFTDADPTEAFLRKFSGIREPHKLVLQNIPGPRATGRLPGSTEMAVAIAIWSAPERMLPLQGIYNTIENAFTDLRDMPDKPWKRTIRHTLSLKGMFTAVSRSASGRGKFWALNVARSSTEKRQRKRRQSTNSRGMQSAKATSPESQISDLDHDYNELWLNNLHMQEVSAQADLMLSTTGAADGLAIFDSFSSLQSATAVFGGPDMLSLIPDAYFPFLGSTSSSTVSFDWTMTHNPVQQSDKSDGRTESFIYHSHPLTMSMPHQPFSQAQ